MKNILLAILFVFSIPTKSIAQDDFLETSGDILLYALPATSLTANLVYKDGKGAWQFIKGAGTTIALTYGLKAIIKSDRPNMQNDNSFPSGHTSVTFQSAAFLQKRYGWAWGIPAYTLAAYTGFTRIHSKNHRFVDVFVGAVIGAGSAYIFTDSLEKNNLKLTFNSNTEDFLLGVVYSF